MVCNINYGLKDFSFLPEAISYKQLSRIFAAAPKEQLTEKEEHPLSNNEKVVFEQLIKRWSSLSQELLQELSDKNKTP